MALDEVGRYSLHSRAMGNEHLTDWVKAERGRLTALADALGVQHNSIYSWNRVPAERVIDVERITGIPREELRPDLYPPTAHSPAPSVQGGQG